MSTLDEEAHHLWERLVDRHNACFQHGMPLPETAEIRARYRWLIAKASSRYIRRVVRPAVLHVRPDQVDMAPVDMDQVLECATVVYVDSPLSINANDLSTITAGTITGAQLNDAPIAIDLSPDLTRLHEIEAAARNLLAALQAYQDGLTTGTGDLEPLYLRWLAAVQALNEALQ